jgi:hypothetical protein
MRHLARLALVAAGLALAAPAAAADAGVIPLELEVGQKVTVGGLTAMCDDATVATITLGGQATITALKPGRTTCSARVGGLLRVYDVKVKAPPPAGDPAAPRTPGEGRGL